MHGLETHTYVFLALLLRYVMQDTWRWWRARRSSGGSVVEIGVEGMSCNGCVSSLERALQGAEGVDSAVVSLDPGHAVVQGSLSRERVADLVKEAGYVPV